MSLNTARTEQKFKAFNLSHIVYVIIAIFGVIYAYITYRSGLLLNTGKSVKASYFITHLSFILPEILVWVIAARGAIKLKIYARKVINSDDGLAFNYIADALILLVLYSIFISMQVNVRMLFEYTRYLREATALSNHIPVLIFLASSIYLIIGTQKLNRIVIVGFRNLRSPKVILLMASFLVIVALYSWRFYSIAASITDDDNLPHFALTSRTMLITYVLPQIVSWFLGVLACFNLAHYMQRVEGKIYKILLSDLCWGILFVYACTFLVQILFLTNIKTTQFNPMSLLVFGILLLLVISWLRVHRGTSQLSRLEE